MKPRSMHPRQPGAQRYPALLATILIAAALGCAVNQPTMQQGPDAEVTYDGLVRLDHTVMRMAWMKPGTDFSHYSKLLLVPGEFKYRTVTGNPRARNAREFPISERNRERLAEAAHRIFRDELARSKYFTIVDAPGPDVLVLKGALVDIVSTTPPPSVGRDQIFIERFGEATLVLEISDSMSGETLARAADRRAADSDWVREANTVTSWAEVQRMLQRWAVILRQGLDGFHNLSPDTTGAAPS